MTIKLLSLSASPVEHGSTDLLLEEIITGFKDSLPKSIRLEIKRVRLNDLKGVACQSCGEAPTDSYCFFEDDISGVYDSLAACDCLVFGSPIHFDSVSAQAKLFIDRCNCFRPPDFDNKEPNHDFIKLLSRQRPGAMVLVGGKEGWFEGARRCIAGFFKWIEVTNEGLVVFRSDNYLQKGLAREHAETIVEARSLGKTLAGKVVSIDAE